VTSTLADRRFSINWVLPVANMSGGTKSNRLLAEAMVRRGHRVRIIYPSMGKAWPSMRHPRRWLARAVKELHAVGRQRHHLESSSAELLPVRERPIRGESVPDADFAVATWWETREWIESWPREKGRPIYMVRGYELHGGDPERVASTYRLAGQKFVISRWLQRVMAEEYGDLTTVLVSNGVDRDQFSAPPRARSDPPRVGMLYGHAVWKGSETAFEAIRLVQGRIPALGVVAFGSQRPARGTALPRNFEFHHRPPQRELSKLYAGCDCWVVSSTFEGFGMPGIEAAACRCPIVSTRCGGPEDYVKDGVNGYLVPVGDAGEMAEGILKVLTCEPREWLRMSTESLEISRQFDWDRSAEIMERTLIAQFDAG